MMENEALEEIAVTEDMSSDSQEPSSSTPAEPVRTYTPKEVSTVVERERKRAYEKGKREAMTQLESQVTQQEAESSAVSSSPQAPGLTRAEIEKITQEQTLKVLQEQIANAQVQSHMQSLATKIQEAEHELPGITQQVQEMDFQYSGELLSVIAGMDNAPEVLKELYDNPSKLANFTVLANTQKTSTLLKKAVNDLSTSIKRNKDALQSTPHIKAPLNQIKASSQQTGADSKSMSVADFRKMFHKG